MKKFILSLIALFCSISYAETSLSTSKSTASIAAKCYLTTQDIEWGELNLGQANSANGQVSVKCSRTTAYSIYIHYSYYPTFSHLTGINKGDTIRYAIKNLQTGIYFESSGAYTHPFTGVGNGLDQTYNMLAYMNNAGYPTPDIYKDTLTVLVTY